MLAELRCLDVYHVRFIGLKLFCSCPEWSEGTWSLGFLVVAQCFDVL